MMKNLIVAAAFAALSLSHASARTFTCSGENFAKMMEHMSTMPYGPKRMAMSREMAAINTDLSSGNESGACTHYAIALRIQNNVRDPFKDFHQE
jgi:hypothetical protein